METAQEEEQALEAAFTGTPTETPEPVKTEDPQPPETPVSTTPEPEFVQLTKSERDDLLKIKGMIGRLDEGFGMLGHLKQIGMDKLQKLVTDMQQGSSGVTVAKEDFDELVKAEFPELAGLLAPALNRIFSRMKAGSPVDVQAILQGEKANWKAEAKREARDEACIEYLDDEVATWREIVGPEKPPEGQPLSAFRQWAKSTLTQERYQKVFSSQNGPYLAKVIREFEEAQSKGKPAKDETRKERLSAAVTPKGSPPASPAPKTEEDEFEGSFNATIKARGGLV